MIKTLSIIEGFFCSTQTNKMFKYWYCSCFTLHACHFLQIWICYFKFATILFFSYQTPYVCSIDFLFKLATLGASFPEAMNYSCISCYRNNTLFSLWFIIFVIQMLSIIGFGPCQQLHCKNGGSCLATSSTAKCGCAPGYTGTTCDKGLCIDENTFSLKAFCYI